jgi:hypothetical protein
MEVDTRGKIYELFGQMLKDRGIRLNVPLCDDLALLNSGLDSLGFAILVTSLDEELGYDPFVMMETPVYPRTLGEFVAVYEQHKPKA